MQPEVCVTDKRGGLSGDGREGGGIDAGDYDSISDMTTLASMMISLPSTMLLRHQHISQLAPLIAMVIFNVFFISFYNVFCKFFYKFF